MTEVVIVSAVRTAIGNFGGSLAATPAPQLGALVATEAIRRAGIDASLVDEAILGNVLQAGLGQNPARQAVLNAGMPESIPATSINIVCGSGLKSVILAAQAIASGGADTVLAGGMENMSAAPFLLDQVRHGYRLGDGKLIDSIMHDGLTCAINGYPMGITAENLAERYGISRAEQDEIALLSQQRAAAAIERGAFRAEIVPVATGRTGNGAVFDTDEHPHTHLSAGVLARLSPAFRKDGTVTAGNASGINDGAAALVLMNAAKAKALALRPVARILGCGTGAVDPAYMGLGPVPATRRALAQANLQVEDLDLIEANEAFAAQYAAVSRELGFSPEKTNVNGGAIALGHPIGASGARILVTLLHALHARDKHLGLATICVGGGQGVALIVERL